MKDHEFEPKTCIHEEHPDFFFLRKRRIPDLFTLLLLEEAKASVKLDKEDEVGTYTVD